MAGKREKPEDVVTKLRRVEVLQVRACRWPMRCARSGYRSIPFTVRGSSMQYAVCSMQYDGMNRAQLSRIKDLEKERLWRAVSDPTLEKLILTEAPAE